MQHTHTETNVCITSKILQFIMQSHMSSMGLQYAKVDY